MRRPALVLGTLVIVAAALAIWWAMRAQGRRRRRGRSTLEAEPGNEAPEAAARRRDSLVPAIRPRPSTRRQDAAAPESAAASLDRTRSTSPGRSSTSAGGRCAQASRRGRDRAAPSACGKDRRRRQVPVSGRAEVRRRRASRRGAGLRRPRPRRRSCRCRRRSSVVRRRHRPREARALRGRSADGPRAEGRSRSRGCQGLFRIGARAGHRAVPDRWPGNARPAEDLRRASTSSRRSRTTSRFRGEARAEVPRRGGTPVDVVLAPAWRLSVAVKDGGTGRGVEGQQVEVDGHGADRGIESASDASRSREIGSLRPMRRAAP